MDEKKYLCFINLIGEDIDSNYTYEFLFTENLDDFWGDDFEQKPAGLCNNLSPIDGTFNTVIKTKIKFKLDLVQNNTCLSIQDCIDGVIALAWENIDEYESYPEDGRIVFHFGDSFESVEDKLARRGTFIFE
jgi:hypothetical protein